MTRTNSGAGKRKNSGVGFKARGALEAIPGEMTVAELVSRHGVYQTLIDTWKRQAPEGMSGIFSGKAAAKSGENDERQPPWPVPTTTLAGGAERRTGMPVRRAAPPA